MRQDQTDHRDKYPDNGIKDTYGPDDSALIKVVSVVSLLRAQLIELLASICYDEKMGSLISHPRKMVHLSLFDAFFYSLMVGIGESYLPAYALSVGMSQAMTGLFTTLPLLGGSFMQLIAPWILLNSIHSIKKWLVNISGFQAFVWLLFFGLALLVSHQLLMNSFFITVILFLLATFYWGSGFATIPTWNFWMSHMVPSLLSTTFFAKRNYVTQAGILLGIIIGGTLLQIFSSFAILFFLAFLARTFSAKLLSLKEDNVSYFKKQDKDGLKGAIYSFYQKQDIKIFFSFLFFFYAVLFISGPFVAPFLLGKLKLSYSQYMGSLVSLFVGKMLPLSFAPKWSKKWGTQKLFLISAFGVSPIPILWVFIQNSSQFGWVLSIQFVSGIFWGLFEVTLGLLFFNHLQSREKISLMTLYNFFNSIAIILGTFIGGRLLLLGHESLNAYSNIFIIGSVLRLFVVTISFWHLKNYSLSRENSSLTQRKVVN